MDEAESVKLREDFETSNLGRLSKVPTAVSSAVLRNGHVKHIRLEHAPNGHSWAIYRDPPVLQTTAAER